MSEISRAKRIPPAPDPLKRRREEQRRRERDKESSSDEESPFDGLEDRADITDAPDDAEEESPPRVDRQRKEDEDEDPSIDVVA